MKHLAVLFVGSLAMACGHNNAPPVASANSVDEASSTPANNPSFAPAAEDGMAAAPADRHAGDGSTNGTSRPTNAPAVDSDKPGASAPKSADAALVATPSGPAPDNTRINTRDKDSSALTPMDQGGSEADRKITQQIRQAVMKDSSLSFTAKNVKIITVNGKVTLRGPVKSAEERAAIEAAAKKVAGTTQVDNLLEVKN